MKKLLTVATLVTIFASSAYALGVTAGTKITNQATLHYSAGDVEQPSVASNTDSFVVDKKVDMILVTTDTDQLSVTPGQKDRETNFKFTNEGNKAQKFKFTVSQLGNNEEADYDTDKDNSNDLTGLEIKCTDDGGTDNGWASDLTIEVPEDGNLTCKVRADINTDANGGKDLDLMNIELLATAKKANGTDDENESNSEDPAVEDVVLADGVSDSTLGKSASDDNSTKGDTPKDGKEAARSGYIINTPVLSATKTSCVVRDPVNRTNTPKRIPGAIIRYMFDVNNTGSANVSDLNITDSLNSNLDLSNTVSSAKKDENQTSCTCSNKPSTDISSDTSLNNQDLTIQKISIKSGKHTCVSVETEIK